MNDLSHFDDAGKIKMVDVSGKETTTRRAVASEQMLSSATLQTLKTRATPKGDPAPRSPASPASWPPKGLRS